MESSSHDDELASAEEGDAVCGKQLSEKVPADLLRAVPLHTALSGFGKHWATPESGMFNIDPNNYELSQVVDYLDTFLSHDWASSRVLKLLSLLIIFNSRAAWVCSLLVSVLVGLLRGYGVLPDTMWTVGFVHVTFFLVLVFGQGLRQLACRPLMVFLDKLCIAQHSEELKQQGILGLAAFLLHSRELVVLWTPRYFSRLWCTLELATFMRLAETQKRIHIMPLKTSLLLLGGSFAWHVLSLGHGVLALSDAEAQLDATLLVSGLMVALATCILPVVYYVGLGLMRDLQQLPEQLSTFRVQDAQCFCCSNNHQHPNTGAPLLCDRALVFKSLRRWYGNEGERTELALDRFNDLVHNVLAPRVMAGLGGSILPLNYTVYMVSSCQLPFLSHYISQWMDQLQHGPTDHIFAWSLRHFMNWGLIPVISVFAVRVSIPLYRAGLVLQRYFACKSRAAVVALLVPCGLFLVSAMWIPYAICNVLASQSASLLWLPLLPFVLNLGITLSLFRPSCRATPPETSRASSVAPPPRPHSLVAAPRPHSLVAARARMAGHKEEKEEHKEDEKEAESQCSERSSVLQL